MVTGRPPYEGPSGVIMQKHVKGEFPDPRVYNRNLSRELCVVIKKMMARMPDDRYETIEDLIEDLAVARMAEDPRGSDARVGKTTILSALKREKILAERYSQRASELKESVANFKLYFFLALGVLVLSLILNLYLFIKLLEK